MTPQEEIAAAAKTLSDLADRVNTHAEHWDAMCGLYAPTDEMRAFVCAMNPAVAREFAHWLSEYEDFEFTEHGPVSDDLAAALRVARAVKGTTGGTP